MSSRRFVTAAEPSEERELAPGEPLGPGAVAARLAAFGLALLLLLTGTFFGSDSDFPFGPFRMYAYRNAPDGFVNSLRLEGINVEGDKFVIRAGAVGLRRAELEGSLDRIKSRPEVMDDIAKRYAANNPHKPELIELHIVVRIYPLKDGKKSGPHYDVIEAVWKRP